MLETNKLLLLHPVGHLYYLPKSMMQVKHKSNFLIEFVEVNGVPICQKTLVHVKEECLSTVNAPMHYANSLIKTVLVILGEWPT